MSGSSYALDTNIVIALMNNDTDVARHLTSASTFVIPSVVIGELYFGAHKSTRVAQNSTRLERFLVGDGARDAIRDIDIDTARLYGQIRDDLRAIGRPIPENDIWIAAIARQHGPTLVTRDQHFAHVAGLALAAW